MRKISKIVLVLVLILNLSACIKVNEHEDVLHNTIQEGNKQDQSHIDTNQETIIEVQDKEETKNKEQEETKQEEQKNKEQQDNKEDNKKEETKKEDNKEQKEENIQDEQSTIETLEVTYNIKALASTLTGKKALSQIKYVIKDPNNTSGLSEKKYSFSFGAAKDGKAHSITVDNQKRFDSYKTNALAWDNKSNDQGLYLTFDCGYEYKNLTSLILDTLKEKNVKATFFVTMEYLEEAPEVVARMIKEGHIVGNHSVNHPSNCAGLSREELAKELLGVHNFLRANYGYNSQYFRFPTGAYSQNALDLVNSLNYRSVFWSIAHSDWDPENQPGADVSFETITSRLHSGAVILLHTTSPDNAEILGDYIDYARNQGYKFKTLDQYKHWK